MCIPPAGSSWECGQFMGVRALVPCTVTNEHALPTLVSAPKGKNKTKYRDTFFHVRQVIWSFKNLS